jgi:hypothetical protein
LIYGPDTPTTASIQLLYHPRCPKRSTHEKPSDPSVSDCALCTELRSLTCIDQHTVLIVLLNLPDHPDFRWTDWAKFQVCMEDGLPSNPNMSNEVAVNTCIEKLSSTIFRSWQSPLPRVACVMTRVPQYRVIFRMKYA